MIKQSNKFILTPEQIDVIRVVHNQLIMDGLVEVGLTRQIEDDILKNSEKNFDMMIKQAQKILTEMGIMDQIREEIKLEEKEEKKALKESLKNKK